MKYLTKKTLLNVSQKYLHKKHQELISVAMIIPFLFLLALQSIPSLGEVFAIILLTGFFVIVSFGCKYFADEANWLSNT